MATSILDKIGIFLDDQIQIHPHRNLHLAVVTGYATAEGLAFLDEHSKAFDSVTVIIGDVKQEHLGPENRRNENWSLTASRFVQRSNVHIVSHPTEFVHLKAYFVLDGSTPLGVLNGSANLTYGGLEGNIESMAQVHHDEWITLVDQFHDILGQCVNIEEKMLKLIGGGDSSFRRTTSSDADYESDSVGVSGWDIAVKVAAIISVALYFTSYWVLWVPIKLYVSSARKGYAQAQYIYNYWRPSRIHPKLRYAIAFLFEIALWTAILAVVATVVTALLIHFSTLTDVATDVGETTVAVVGTIIGIAILLAIFAIIGALYTSLGFVGGTVALVLLLIGMAILLNRCGISL